MKRTTAGKAVGLGCAFLSMAFVVLVVGPVFASERVVAAHSRCYSHARALGVALLQYAERSDGSLPTSTHWIAAVRPFLSSDLARKPYWTCPVHHAPYSMPGSVSGRRLDSFENLRGQLILQESGQACDHDSLHYSVLANGRPRRMVCSE